MKLSWDVPSLWLEGKRQIKDSLVKNSLFLMMSSVVRALAGAIFWVVVARFYLVQDVGIAGAVLPAIALLTGFSHLGLPIGLIRYLPETEFKRGVLGTSFILVGLSSLVLALIFLGGLSLWSPELLFLQRDAGLSLLFVLFTIATALFLIMRTTFIALRQGKYVLLQQSSADILRLALPLALLGMGAFGIVSAYGVGMWVALFLCFAILVKLTHNREKLPLVHPRLLKGLLRYSLINYVAENIGQLPPHLLPLIVLSMLGAEANAYYYIALMIMNVLYMIPVAVISSFFAESSHEPERLRHYTTRTVKLLLILTIPMVALVTLAGDKILLIFGYEYSEQGWEVLRLLSLSTLPFAFNELWITMRRVRKELKPVLAAYSAIAGLILGLCYALIGPLGIEGVGLAWLLGQGVVAAFLAIKTLWPRLKASLLTR